MHSMIAWFARNHVAANLLMIATLAAGIYSIFFRIPLEVFPAFELDVITVTASYPGAAPNEVEEGVILHIEESLANLADIKHITSGAFEGRASVTVEIKKDYDLDKSLNEIKSRVDAITVFPEDVERPIVSTQTRTRENINLVVSGELSERELHEYTTLIRDEVSQLSGITQTSIAGLRPYEISINISEQVLRRYGLTLASISQAIKASSRDIPAGILKTNAGEIRVRTLGQSYTKADFAKISILKNADGTQVRLGDIANIKDHFSEVPLYAMFDDQHSGIIEIYRVGDQSALKISETIKKYISERNDTLPANVTLSYWKDNAKIVKARLQTLTTSAFQGMILIFLLLSLFLRPTVAVWVSLGIPISFMGAMSILPSLGVTLNLISLFAFIVVLGIVVDDAIVTGENIYSHIKKGTDPQKAAIIGTQEISIPVTFGILTTVAAFTPLLMIAGVRGQIFAQIPKVIIPVLLFSLIESKLILPAHMRNIRPRNIANGGMGLLTRVQQSVARGLELFIEKIYQPFLELVIRARYFTLTFFIAMLVLSILLVSTGRFHFTFFPRVQSEFGRVNIIMPEGTPQHITIKHVEHIQKQLKTLQDKYREPTGESIIQHILVTVGSTGGSRKSLAQGASHLARVQFETIPPEYRTLTVTSSQLIREWRKLIGPIPGIKDLSFRAEIGHAGQPLAIQLKGDDFKELEAVSALIKEKLASFDGIFDITDSLEGGKDEVQMRIRPDAELLGLSLSDIGQQVRNAIYGSEAQNIQRGRESVKVIVRLPENERHSLSDLSKLRIRTQNGSEIPLLEAVDITIGQGYTQIKRYDRKRVLDVSADINKKVVNATTVMKEITEWIPDILALHPSVSYSQEGEQGEQAEAFRSLMAGLGFALLTIYALLAIPFRSYSQPLIVMAVIPFSIIGALAGHAILGMTLSISSLLGLLALTGVVVNDSLVLVDYINRRRLEGMEIKQAVLIAGGARFRPILLTSLTTFVGLLPLIFEKSTQAQFLIPMAVSLGFGILFATFICLLLVPVSYLILEDFKRIRIFG
ncbi:MAG TPA: efflux RND transporter permease subunit [Leucothrix mucor]|nr:efflux RND transporter permease subunit [Leucothrix mucor]